MRVTAWRFRRLEPREPRDEHGYRPVVAVDPGLDTGVAYLLPDGAVFGAEEPWDDAMVTVQRVLASLVPFKPATVVEAFVITERTARNSQAPWSLEGIGVARFLARRFGASFETQMPAEAKRFSTDARLRAQGWYKATPGGHVNDALRHLYLRLVKDRVIEPPAGVV